MKYLITYFFLIVTIYGTAQVKIGDNPSTIDPNSLLEVEGDNKGVLIPRVLLNDATNEAPLTAPVPEGMLIYNDGGTEENGFYYWDGSQFRMIITSVNAGVRDNFVRVKSEADLPAPSGGIITLASGTVYEINGTITLTNSIDLNGAYLIGMDANNDILQYTPSSGSMFTGGNGGTIKTVTMLAPNSGAKLFNLDDVSSSKSLIIRGCNVVNSADIGIIKGFNILFAEIINFSGNTNGITYEDINSLLLVNVAWFSNNSNTFETLIGDFNSIEKISGFSSPTASNSATGLDVSGVTSVGSGQVKNVTFTGDGNRVIGSFSKQWEVDAAGIDTEKDDVAAGNIYITTPTTTSISSVDVPVKIAGTTTSAYLFRTTSGVDNRIVYDGTKTRRFNVSASLSMWSPANNKVYSFYIYLNGSKLTYSKQSRKIANANDVGSLSISAVVELEPGDYVEVWVENNTNNSDIVIESMNFSIR